MLKKLNFKVTFCLFVLMFPLTLSSLGVRAEEQETAEESKKRTLKIVSWNIQNLGQSKAGFRSSESSKAHARDKTLGKIAEIIRVAEIDLIAIQEYTDHGVEPVVKNKFLQQFPEEENWCGIASSNTGGEKYLILYRKDIVKPINPKIRIYEDWDLEMERLPGYCTFQTEDGSFDFTIITCHNRTWGNGAKKDAKFLYEVYKGVQARLGAEDNDIIILGDFNIKHEHELHFGELKDEGFFKQAIGFEEDTMVSKENKSNLDNIFYIENTIENTGLERNTGLDFKRSGVIRSPFIDKRVSDHYPVWVIFKIPEVDKDAPEPE